MKGIKFFFTGGSYRGSHRFRRFTPNNSSKWGNIVSIDNIDDADYIVVYQSTVIDLSNIPPDRIVYIQHEPDEFIFVQHMWDDVNPLSHKYPFSAQPAPLMEWSIMLKTYDELKREDFPPKAKDLSWVTSNYGDGSQPPHIQVLSGHRLRMQFLQNFLRKFPDKMDLFGKRLEGPRYDYRCNRGALFDKWEGLKDYRYTFGFESSWQKGWVSEKLCDGVLAGCMTIYWGCPNLEEFLPDGSFIRLDIAKEDAPERAIEIVNSDFREKHLDALREAKELILDKYNIWASLYRILNQLDKRVR